MARKEYEDTLEAQDITMYQANQIPSLLRMFYSEGNIHFAIKELDDCIIYCDIIKNKCQDGKKFMSGTLNKMIRRK